MQVDDGILSKSRWVSLGAILLVLVVFVGAIAAMGAQDAPAPPHEPVETWPAARATLTQAELLAAARPVGFEELARNTEAWVGELVRLRGEVVEVSEAGSNGAVLRVNVTENSSGFWTDTVWVEYPGYGPGRRVLEGDLIEFVAQVDGRHTYTAVLGQKITLPRMTATWLAVK
jgi:hypothetical protein